MTVKPSSPRPPGYPPGSAEEVAGILKAQEAQKAAVQITRDDMALALGQRDFEILILQKRIKQLEEQLAKASVT